MYTSGNGVDTMARKEKPITRAELKRAYSSGIPMNRISLELMQSSEALSIELPNESPYSLEDSWRGLMLVLLKVLQSKNGIRTLQDKLGAAKIGGGLRISSLYTVEAGADGDIYPLILGNDTTGYTYVHCDYSVNTYHSNIGKLFTAVGIDPKGVLVVLHKNSEVDEGVKAYKEAKRAKKVSVVKSLSYLIASDNTLSGIRYIQVEGFTYECKSYVEAVSKLLEHTYNTRPLNWEQRILPLNMNEVIWVVQGYTEESGTRIGDIDYTLYNDATPEDMLQYMELVCLVFNIDTEAVMIELSTLKIM